MADTDYPLGVVKAIPYQAHLALALFEFSSLAADVDAVRRANAEDPHRKIYDGTPAVRPAAAVT